MEEQNIEQKPKDGNKQIAGAIIVAGMLIAGAILLKGNMPQQSAVSPGGEKLSFITTNARAVSPDEHLLENLNASVVIIEYSDTECPFCKVFHNTLHKVVEKNNGQVAWVYRHYPIAELHPKAFKEALATECAWEQGGNNGFWEYIDEVFERTESNNKLDPAELPKIAKDLSLDLASFNSCLESEKYASKVQADIEDSNRAGAVGTPFSLIINKKDIKAKTQGEIVDALAKFQNSQGAVSFDSKNKNIMSMNGALPEAMIDSILAILLK